MVKVTVKWGKQKYDLQLNEQGALIEFKALLLSLTTVPVEKQKIIYKGNTWKDDINLKSLNLTDGANIMLMGAAENKKLVEPETKTVFIQDKKIVLNDTGRPLPIGLKNLGNTCYLNSCLQIFRRVNEFKNFLIYPTGSSNDILVSEFSQLYMQMEKAGGPAYVPMSFVQIFMAIFSQFNQRTQDGRAFEQQDADECFQAIMTKLEPLIIVQNKAGNNENLLPKLFQIEFESTLTNLENPDQPPRHMKETDKKLMCSVLTGTKPVNNIEQGLNLTYNQNLSMISEFDKMEHNYSKQMRISKLPGYVLVQITRFSWKEENIYSFGKATKSQINRPIVFPKILDLAGLCSDELKQNLDVGRQIQKERLQNRGDVETQKFQEYQQKLEESGTQMPDDTRALFKQFKLNYEEEEIKSADSNLYRPHGTGKETGNFQLIGVLTHEGRTADSGHYMAYTHESADVWWQFDDDVVKETTLQKVLDLKGGPDMPIAYYLLYRKLEVD